MKIYKGYFKPDETITNLILPIKAEWYDMIDSDIKKEEYREIKPYWTKRFQKIGALDDKEKPTDMKCCVYFRNGYRRDSRTMLVWFQLAIGEGRKEWGAKEGEIYYILKILTHLQVIMQDKDGE